jgi:hypothetical protein
MLVEGLALDYPATVRFSTRDMWIKILVARMITYISDLFDV